MRFHLGLISSLAFVALYFKLSAACTYGEYDKCPNWDPCSKSCGGGRQCRTCESCAWSIDKRFCQNCNEFCYNGHRFSNGRCQCPSWRYGDCCETCNHIYIDHCKDGQKQCGGSPDGIMCTDCNAPYYSGGFNRGCIECPRIIQCELRHCTNIWNTQCDTCYGNRVIFKPWNGDRECQRICAWNNHYCWPGTCSTDELTKDCQCAKGFVKRSTEDYSAINAGETTCQPNIPPEILTCDTVVVGTNGEKKQALSTANSTECRYISDMYGNYQPVRIQFKMASEFTVDTSTFTATRPKFIKEETFGISDTTLQIFIQTVTGSFVSKSTHNQLEDRNYSMSVVQVQHDSGNISVTDSKYNLQNGEALCLEFEAKGGGYLISKNIGTPTHNTSGPVPYTKVIKQRKVCYRYDDAPPEHCSKFKDCTSEPLTVLNRVTRSEISTVDFKGWIDPIPVGGGNYTASTIERYEVRVNEVPSSKGTLQVDYTKTTFTESLASDIQSLRLNLTSDSPRLYCITLEVKDVADNVRQTRRFMLYDNTSFIETWKEKTFRFDSASPQTNYIWQTNHNNVCISWKDFFLNKFYFDNQLLNPIQPEPNGLINDIYEQTTGILPVSGTPNVHGIIKYYITWKLNDGHDTLQQIVPDFQNQSFCTRLNLSDGQTYTFKIRPVDIVNNTYNESRTVYIDRSHPHINDIWLTKDGYETLYVHNSTDLSKMQMTFDALDPHSGLRSIHWMFGIANTSSVLTQGHLAVRQINKTCPPDSVECYCPDIGKCESFNYSIPLNQLVKEDKHTGNHNRNYFFTITVTNNAMLTTTEHIDVLVDESQPEEGVVIEGPIDSNDIDYTSDDSFMVHWRGFIDHESGIKIYRIGLAERCLTREELFNLVKVNVMMVYKELPYKETSVRLLANFTGKRYVTVIALNNAMEASNPVCSDGITRDESAPYIRNITLQHATWSESIVCNKGRPHLLQSNLKKVPLHNSTVCSNLCTAKPDTNIADYLPIYSAASKDEHISNFLCIHLPFYTNESIVFLPNDHIVLEWHIDETGSQMDDCYVGIGLDVTEINSPSLVDYISTERKQYFKHNHEGIGSNRLFYIFIKAINKASLSSIATLGPILIDETPPLYTQIPPVIIEEKSIVFAWESKTFYDDEQIEQINQIIFQYGHDEKAVSPLLEWRLDSSSPCPPHTGGCIRYPLARLQNQDTGDGLQYYLNLHVYNNAGHFVSIRTETFRLPSRYTPGDGVVFDLDPEEQNASMDIDVQFTEQVLCARWMGFRHHENVSLEVGIGSNRSTSDVVPLKSISENINSMCLKSSSIVKNEVYFFLVRANCSGGSTISSSNGVRIYQKQLLEKSTHVKIGKDCLTTFENIMNVSLRNYTAISKTPFSLTIGQRYVLFMEDNEWQNILDITTNDGIIHKKSNVYYIRAFIEKPTIHIKHSFLSEYSVLLKVNRCPDESMQSINNKLDVSWILDGLQTKKDILFSVGLFTVLDDNSSVEVVAFQKPVAANNYTILDVSLDDRISYLAKVRICNNVRCLRSINSNKFTVEKEVPIVLVTNAELTIKAAGDCVDISAAWKFTGDVKRIGFFQWSLSRDDKGGHLLSVWNTVLSKGSAEMRVEQCVDLPDHGHVTLFLCVRIFSLSGLSSMICQTTTKADYGSYSSGTIYDFDASTDSWLQIKKMLRSSNIGQHYSVLHDSELNIGSSNTTVAGALMYASERKVSWYLMKIQYVPANCENDVNCNVKYDTDSGYVEFSTNDISLNQIYYICAHSNTTEVNRELFTETLKEISSCSNGFVLDSSPPTKGHIQVQNHKGFVTNLQHVLVTWDRFYENIDASIFGYPSKLRTFSVAIGTQPGSYSIDDIVRTGLETSTVLKLQTQPDGSAVFFTLYAKDYAGYVSSSDSLEVTIDTTPPEPGSVTILNNHQRNQFINKEYATFRFEEFSDPHSGLDYFIIGIGTIEGITDIVPETKIHSDYLQLDLNHLIDGQPYFIVVKAVNRAGLISRPVSRRFVLDQSAPTGGHVLDGFKGQKEIDYQSNSDTIHANWKDFDDPESGLAFYNVGLGTDAYQTNIRQIVDVGLRTDVFWNGPFNPGQKYFVIVEACNKADLCTRRVSDGIIVDYSPPIRGLVRVGPGEGHSKYLGHRSSIQINWQGFEDPQSGIDHYDVCVSTSRRYCDVLTLSNGLLHSSFIKSNIKLPTNTQLFATVWAFNRVGMNVSKTSDIFVVDESPPVIRNLPNFLLTYNSAIGKYSQWEKSLVRLQWEFEDNISPIVRHEISLKTHHEGHTPLDHLILGSERHVTISLDGKNWLNDGDTYYAIVTSCNAASLCSSERTPDLLIDSTAPHLGGFKPPMTWTNYYDSNGNVFTNLSLTWYGFHDQESGIDNFYITVSRLYGLDELSNGLITVRNGNNTEEMQALITLSERLLSDDRIVLSIWAQNNVGLNSSIARITVTILSSTASNEKGILEIEKHSCDVHFCNKDCTCAVIGRPCVEVITNLTCSNISNSDALAHNLPVIIVRAGLSQEVLNISASSACLSGHWSRTDSENVSENIRRFEWSIGVRRQPVGEGIFDLKLENPWTDIGLRSEFTHCLPINRTFVHGTQYVVYVRVWYELNEYSVFESSPIMIDQTGPSVRRGRYIREGNCLQDLDFIDWTDSIIACWDGVFSEQQSTIDHFSLSLGTLPHSDDIIHQTDMGLATNISINSLFLNPGTSYYFTVIAVNSVGLHTALVSDGFVIDTDNPIDGVVFNTKHHQNSAFQQSTNSFEISWHGFQDHFSGIKYYLAAISNIRQYHSLNISFMNVGLLRAYTFTNLNLIHGESYFGIVKAVDAAGHESSAVFSPEQSVDSTPPEGFTCASMQQLPIDVSYKVIDGDLSVFFNSTFVKDNLYHIRGSIRDAKYDLYPVLTINRHREPASLQRRHDGLFQYQFYFISPITGMQFVDIEFGSHVVEAMLQNVSFEECNMLPANNTDAVSIKQIGPYSIAVNLLIMDTESEIRTVSLGVGTTKGGFQIQSLSELYKRNNFEIIFAPFTHGTPIYVTAIAENHAGLKTVFHSERVIIIDHTAPLLNDVDVSVAVAKNNSSSLHVTWKVSDNESDVQFCRCAVGSAPLTGEIQAETDSETLRSFRSKLLDLAHGDIVYITTKCVNKVELTTTLVSRPVTIYLSPPSSTYAFVRFLPVSQESMSLNYPLSSEIAWQSNASMLQMEWDNFEDLSQITSYIYRFHSDGEIVMDWMDVGLKDTISNVNLKLKSGITYTAEVKAVNGGGFNSSRVHSSLIIVSEPPVLTGQPVSAVFRQGKLTLDWNNVFNIISGIPHHYSLVVGSRDGFSDVVDVSYTRDHLYDVSVPASTLVSSDLNELFVKITCTYNTGLFSIYSTTYKV